CCTQNILNGSAHTLIKARSIVLSRTCTMQPRTKGSISGSMVSAACLKQRSPAENGTETITRQILNKFGVLLPATKLKYRRCRLCVVRSRLFFTAHRGPEKHIQRTNWLNP